MICIVSLYSQIPTFDAVCLFCPWAALSFSEFGTHHAQNQWPRSGHVPNYLYVGWMIVTGHGVVISLCKMDFFQMKFLKMIRLGTPDFSDCGWLVFFRKTHFRSISNLNWFIDKRHRCPFKFDFLTFRIVDSKVLSVPWIMVRLVPTSATTMPDHLNM